MKKPLHLLHGAAVAACLLMGTSAMAQMSPTDFNAGKTRIKNDYSTEKKTCSSQSGNARDICVAEAKGKENVALAELDNSYKPTLKTQYKVRAEQADATYDVAIQKCDEMKTGQTNAAAKTDNKEVRTDAAADKRAAELKVAEEKCDALASTAKDTCMAAAKAKFGKM